jgi:5-methylcytosine-specific restriction endonuclease McrA
MQPEEIPAYIPGLLYSYLCERLELQARLQALHDEEPEVLRDACRQAARLGTLQPMVQWLAAHTAVVTGDLLQPVLHEWVGATLDAPPDAPWQAQLWDLIVALPPSVTSTTVLTALRAAWPALRQACVLCHPAHAPTRLDLSRLRTGLKTGELPYARATLEQSLCAACWTAYDVQAKWQAYQHRVDAEQRQRQAATAHRRWQRRLAHYERGTGDPATNFATLCQLLTAEDCQQLATMPYHAFLHTPYCQLCPATTALQVHHRTYAHRGQEYQYLEDLVVLCETCHATHHHILSPPPSRPDGPPDPA